jgi:puromycin-sensitive aminopeptidase
VSSLLAKKIEKKHNIDAYKGQTRLSNFAIPKRYELHLIPNFSSCTFSGIVQINLTINENTNSIVLNSLELVIQNTWFTNSYGKVSCIFLST